MKKIIAYIRRKLSVRVSLWVVMFAAIIFNVVGYFVGLWLTKAVMGTIKRKQTMRRTAIKKKDNQIAC